MLTGIQACHTDQVVTVAEGAPTEPLCTVGPFTLDGRCIASAADTVVILAMTTTEANSFVRGPNANFDVFDAVGFAPIASQTDSPGVGRVQSGGAFYAGAPSGAQLSGVGGAIADADANSCMLTVNATN